MFAREYHFGQSYWKRVESEQETSPLYMDNFEDFKLKKIGTTARPSAFLSPGFLSFIQSHFYCKIHF